MESSTQFFAAFCSRHWTYILTKQVLNLRNYSLSHGEYKKLFLGLGLYGTHMDVKKHELDFYICATRERGHHHWTYHCPICRTTNFIHFWLVFSGPSGVMSWLQPLFVRYPLDFLWLTAFSDHMCYFFREFSQTTSSIRTALCACMHGFSASWIHRPVYVVLFAINQAFCLPMSREGQALPLVGDLVEVVFFYFLIFNFPVVSFFL